MRCTSCAAPPEDSPRPPHDAGDHYGGTGACSLCECAAYTAPEAPPAPVPLDPVMVGTQLAELREELHRLAGAIGQRDASIMAAQDAAERVARRADVIEAEARELREQLGRLQLTPAPEPPPQ